ncbi:unnamed protein product [Rotaria socialis]|uniref:Uncharacterized protein n=2 Tax=Rotaria socialis TaxID=392032 RepID=A0A820T7A4_9BILA|nr:unnamed protein product [Rotaria socialis]
MDGAPNLKAEQKELAIDFGQYSWPFQIVFLVHLPPFFNQPATYPHIRKRHFSMCRVTLAKIVNTHEENLIETYSFNIPEDRLLSTYEFHNTTQATDYAHVHYCFKIDLKVEDIFANLLVRIPFILGIHRKRDQKGNLLITKKVWIVAMEQNRIELLSNNKSLNSFKFIKNDSRLKIKIS